MRTTAFILAVAAGIAAASPLGAMILRSKGQTIYVPCYSHIYAGPRQRPFDLTVTLSLRNTDPQHSISLQKVTYFDSNGVMLKEYLQGPQPLAPMATTRFIVKESDRSGGSGANFIVRWQSERPTTLPIVESVMIGTQAGQGISFVSRGRVIAETLP